VTARRRYLISYDVADDRRRSRIHDACRQHGDRTQYSVFVAELDDREFVRLRAEIEAIVHRSDDQVLFADLGPADRDSGQIIASLGRPYQPPVRVFVV
jgi:CRISPR-associated protein Cas2